MSARAASAGLSCLLEEEEGFAAVVFAFVVRVLFCFFDAAGLFF